MTVYVETNFVLELALLQAEHASCQKILKLCEAGQAQLAFPAYSLVEPYEKLGRSNARRNALRVQLDGEVAQLERTRTYADEARTLKKLSNALLIASTHMDRKNLERVRARVLNVADVIPLDSEVLSSARKYEKRLGFESSQDAIVFASVLRHLLQSKPAQSCFLTLNKTDFSPPEVASELQRKGRNCKLLFKFQDGYAYICGLRGKSRPDKTEE